MSSGTESNYPSLYGRNGQRVPIPEEYVSAVTGETYRPLDGNSEPREPVRDIRDNRPPEFMDIYIEMELKKIRSRNGGKPELKSYANRVKRGTELLRYQRNLALQQQQKP